MNPEAPILLKEKLHEPLDLNWERHSLERYTRRKPPVPVCRFQIGRIPSRRVLCCPLLQRLRICRLDAVIGFAQAREWSEALPLGDENISIRERIYGCTWRAHKDLEDTADFGDTCIARLLQLFNDSQRLHIAVDFSAASELLFEATAGQRDQPVAFICRNHPVRRGQTKCWQVLAAIDPFSAVIHAPDDVVDYDDRIV